MSESAAIEQTALPGELLLDYYEDIYVAERWIGYAEEAMGSSSPDRTFREVVREYGLRPSHASTLTGARADIVSRRVLAAHFAYAAAEEILRTNQAKIAETVESITLVSPKIVGKMMVARSLQDYPNAIIWRREPFGRSGPFSSNTPVTHAEGAHLSGLPVSASNGEELELCPSGPRSLLGVYGVPLLNGEGQRMVELTVQS